ncbi:MAG: hypothetical protein NTY12_03895 [Candidatus Falkowbacteria bacterium]|nr:hypothetical protein [Candidatus Falkowbacteria bacterium]
MKFNFIKQLTGKNKNNFNGYITLISVLVIGAIGTAVVISVIWLGIGSSRSSFADEQSDQAWGLANACAEEALQQIRSSSAYTGTGNLTLGQGTCSYTVTNTGGTTRSVTASGTVGTMIRRSAISITALNPKLVISSWQEVAN